MGHASGLNFGVAYGAVVNAILWSYELQLFFSLCKHGITALIGAPGNGNAVEDTLAFTCRTGVNLDQKSKWNRLVIIC